MNDREKEKFFNNLTSKKGPDGNMGMTYATGTAMRENEEMIQSMRIKFDDKLQTRCMDAHDAISRGDDLDDDTVRMIDHSMALLIIESIHRTMKNRWLERQIEARG